MDAKEIVRVYDVLQLADVHAVISYYLRHKQEVQAYLHRREEEAEALEQQIRAAQPPQEELREQLLARRARMSGTHAAGSNGL